ncbi:unnamed protein product [Gongylonema pulchrum]|uniref:Uncharacterized protein n=1 Tax=Gongylonema pulchrum TaxID=637853 RepID=A0A183ERY7_9BILA|nr:unnamed protein product [Gongylonema pulchrum]
MTQQPPPTTTWSRRSVSIVPSTPFATTVLNAENFFKYDYSSPHGAIMSCRKGSYNPMQATSQVAQTTQLFL